MAAPSGTVQKRQCTTAKVQKGNHKRQGEPRICLFAAHRTEASLHLQRCMAVRNRLTICVLTQALTVLPSPPMSKWLCVLLLAMAQLAHAAPEGASDALIEQPRASSSEQKLLSRLDAVRHSVVDHTSDLVLTAMGFLGVPYRRGGNSAETGFDCSGLVREIYGQTIGLMLPRRADQQAAATETIEKNDLKPGDLVFFNTMRRTFSHVGVYIGEGKFIHAPRTGANVRVESMQTSYWMRRFDGARRVNASYADAGGIGNQSEGF